jgi:hypothetical protein
MSSRLPIAPLAMHAQLVALSLAAMPFVVTTALRPPQAAAPSLAGVSMAIPGQRGGGA